MKSTIRFVQLVELQGHAAKNVGGQLNSPLRTLMFGQIFTDTTAARALGMPPCSYARTSPMSDALHAGLFNPFYTVLDPAVAVKHAEIPWNLRGFLLLNLCTALCCVAYLKRGTGM